MINSRPIFGLRWYGFGNVTFAAYAGAGLILAGYVAHRLLMAGRRAAAVAAVGAIGFGIVICEGWPSMGSDFGGVIALTPAVLWLMLALGCEDDLAQAVGDRWLGGAGGRCDFSARLVPRAGSADSPGQFCAANH